MPTYDYKCNSCNETYDVFHKVREVMEDVVCPHCGSVDHTRLISAPTVKRGKNSGPSFGNEMPSCPNADRCGDSCGLN
jgi:putative FmdB family regulatory protein